MKSRRRNVDVRRLARIARDAIRGGYGELKRTGLVHLHLAMDCEQPYGFTLFSRGGISLTGERIRPLTVTGQSRCRKCGPCRKRKSMFWAARAIDEYNRHPRTLMGTFTLNPVEHLELDNRARIRLRQEGKDFDLMTDQEMFAERVREFGYEVTKWIKRIRKGRPWQKRLSLRYLLVAEVHDSEKTSDELRGRPHFHMLLHEEVAGSAVLGSPAAALLCPRTDTVCDVEAGEWERRMVRHKDGVWRPHAFVRDEAFIRKNWTLGFTKFQWADSHKSAWYVCKYVSKSLIDTRVRASQRYGRLPREATGEGKLKKRPGEGLTPQGLKGIGGGEGGNLKERSSPLNSD